MSHMKLLLLSAVVTLGIYAASKKLAPEILAKVGL